jgi:hypothetical protein
LILVITFSDISFGCFREMVVQWHLFTIERPKNLHSFYIVRLIFHVNVITRRKESVVDVFKEVSFQVFVLSLTEVVEIMDLSQSLTGLRCR